MVAPTVHYAEGTQSQGNVKVIVALSLTSLTAPSLAEINVGTSVDLSMALYASGYKPDVTTNKGTKPPRLASKATIESFNRSTYTFPDLVYAFDPQADDTDPDNAVLAALEEGLTVYVVERLGKDAETVDIAIGDWVRIHKVKLGEQVPVFNPDDENDEIATRQSAIYATPPSKRVKVVA